MSETLPVIKEIPKDYKYDTETKDFLVYRHKYTGDEIHIEKPIPLYRLEQEPILDKIEPKCDRINSLASVLPYAAHREIQELLCEIINLCKTESEE